MTTLTTNRLLSKALRTLCYAGALAVTSTWATVVTWQLNPGGPGGDIVAIKTLSQSGYAPTARGVDNMPVTDASHQFLFGTAPTIQFASMANGLTAVSVISAANVGIVPVPEMSALFPIVGLIVAVSCTQILRRRRAAQQSAFRRQV